MLFDSLFSVFHCQPRLRKAFDDADMNKDGYLDKEERPGNRKFLCGSKACLSSIPGFAQGNFYFGPKGNDSFLGVFLNKSKFCVSFD